MCLLLRMQGRIRQANEDWLSFHLVKFVRVAKVRFQGVACDPHNVRCNFESVTALVHDMQLCCKKQSMSPSLPRKHTLAHSSSLSEALS